MRSHALEKDVVHYRVELSGPLDPEMYTELAGEQLAKLGPVPQNHDYPQAPLYEVRYSFHAGASHLASVVFRLDEDAAGRGDRTLRHQHTFVHSRGDAE